MAIENKENMTDETITEDNENTVTMSKEDFNKVIQSAEDKLRTKYSKEIKELQTKIEGLTPASKSEQEIELENKIKDLEAKEKRLNLQDSLQSKNLDKGLADFLKTDADIETFEKLISSMISSKITATGYTPANHANGDSITKEQWKSMSFSERQNIYEANPEMAKRLMNTK